MFAASDQPSFDQNKSQRSDMKILYLFIPLILMACGKHDNDKKEYVSPLHQLADTNQNYKLPAVNNEITFPEAHFPKKNFRHEWWYITANLTTEQGVDISVQWTLFRTAIKDKHWYFAHAALGRRTQHLSAFRHGREELGNLKITHYPFSASIDEWTWQSSAEFLPAKLNYAGFQGDKMWQVQLNLLGENQFYLQGEQGFNKKHLKLNIASHYYSQPFIKVTGRVLFDYKWQKVKGKAWFDREWGSQMLAADQQGWDWFSLRLKPNLALMVYRIRSEKEDFIYGSLMQENGEVKILDQNDIKLISMTKSGDNVYPEHFKINIDEYAIYLDVKTINKDQAMRFGIEYFEGMVDFSGSHSGIGFLEMTGY